MIKPQSKFPSIRIAGIPELDRNSLATQVFRQIYIRTIVCLSEITWAHLTELHNQYIYTGRHFEHYLLHHFAFIKELGEEEGLQIFHQDKTMPCE